MSEFRVVLTGAPTGGHLFPLVAVFEELGHLLQSRDLTLQGHFLGRADAFRSELTAAGMTIHSTLSPKWRRYRSVRNWVDLLLAPLALAQAAWHLWLIMPDAVFSKGGGGSVLVVLMSWLFRIPVLIHESDTLPGWSNLYAARFATYIAVSFSRTLAFFPKGKTFLIGHPIRRGILQGKKEEGLRTFELREESPVLLVWAGSQGAEVINDAILNILPQLLPRVQVVHQCGPKNFERVKKESEFMLGSLPQEQRKNYRLEGFIGIDRLPHLLAVCDLVVARAGAGTIFELAAVGKPAILIPLPKIVVGEHQIRNAYDYAEQGGGEVMEQQNLTPHLLAERILMLLEDSERRARMSEAAKKFARPDAARVIAGELVRLGGR